MTAAPVHSTTAPARSAATTTDREHLLSQLFLFAGPALAFVLAVLFVR